MPPSLTRLLRFILVALGARKLIAYLLSWIDPENKYKPSTVSSRKVKVKTQHHVHFALEPSVPPLVASSHSVSTPSPRSLSTRDSPYPSVAPVIPFDIEAESFLSLSTSSDSDSSEPSSLDDLSVDPSLDPPPYTSSPPSIPYTPAFYFKLDVLDTWLNRHSLDLIAADDLALRQLALQHLESEESLERELLSTLSRIRPDLQTCSGLWRKSESRLVGLLNDFLENLSNASPRPYKSQRSRNPRFTPEFRSKFVDLPSLRRPDLRRSNQYFRSQPGYDSTKNLWNAEGCHLRRIVVVREAFLQTFGKVVDFGSSDDEEDEEKPVPIFMIEKLCGAGEEGEGDSETATAVEKEIVVERKRWSDLENDDAFFDELPVF